MANAGGDAKFGESAMAALTARIRAEMDSQLNFGKEWGPLVPGVPVTVEEAIARKKEELAELKAKAAAAGAHEGSHMFVSTTREQFRPFSTNPLEAGLVRSHPKV